MVCRNVKLPCALNRHLPPRETEGCLGRAILAINKKQGGSAAIATRLLVSFIPSYRVLRQQTDTFLDNSRAPDF
jgi:hypothetical protein